MKVVVIYLLFLFSLLLKTHDNVYAGVRHNSTHYSQTQHIQKAAKAQLGNVDGRHFIKRNTVLIEEKEFFGIENEDDTQVFSRKDVLLSDSSVIIVYASILFCFYYYQKKRLPFCKHFSYTASYKYILQRTLRI
jgi:hypothetical protein